MRTITFTEEELKRIVSSLHAMAAIQDNLEEADELEGLAIKIAG